MLTLEEIKEKHDKAFLANQTSRERAADDMVFYFVTQWDSTFLDESQLEYRGEFNIIKKAGRQILSDLAANPIDIDFEPVDETRDDAADIADGLYRTDEQNNSTIDAYTNAKQETVVCGVGAWRLYTDYETRRSGNNNQVIRRWPIFEANNSVYWDPSAKLLDKSDADYVSVLSAYSEEGYKKLVKELTGEEPETIGDSFKAPEQSYVFPWYTESNKIYVVRFYAREKVKAKIMTMADPFGQSMDLAEDQLDEIMDELKATGYTVEGEREIEKWEITEYIASGDEILSTNRIAGQHIPIVPYYGEHAIVEGEEHWEGMVRCAKDPQMLRNFQLSYLADIVSQSPREKPVFLQEQIAGFEDYYSLSGADNNYAYMLQNRLAPDGSPLPIGPIAAVTPPQVPPALTESIALSREAVEDVANPGIPQDIADPDLSGKAVIALQNRLDMQSMVYQEHFKHAKRRDAEIWVSMAAEIYDVPRTVKLTLPDGTAKTAQIMQTVYDDESGDFVTLHDLNNAEFEVFSKIGTAYSTKKDQTIDRLNEMSATMDPADPIRKALQLKVLALMDGVNFDDIREYANMQLVLTGIRKPETDQEKQMLQQAQQQQQQPSAEMVLAMAEDKKGQADMMEQQRKGMEMQLDAANEKLKRMIDAFEAQTSRYEMQVNAEKANAEIENKRADSFGKQIENEAKMIQFREPIEMSTEELFAELGGA